LSMVLERAALMYADELNQSGKLDQNMMQQEWQGIVDAEKEGRLEEMMPGISQAANRGQQQMPQDATPMPPQGMGPRRG
jgi:hypothetical protein